MVRSSALLLLLVLVGCTRAHGVDTGFEVDVVTAPLDCELQLEEADDGLPEDLACAGLYSNFDKKEIAPGNEMFEPAYKLWSDDSEKTRWIRLPKGEQIDSSDMRNWEFPAGTTLWKEFRVNGKRAETRLYTKGEDGWWERTTYIWKDDKEAKREDYGREWPVNGMSYRAPTRTDCNTCHIGSKDEVLGFEAVSLGLGDPEREGLTLAKLVDKDWLSDPPERTSYEIGDDGTGKAADVLGWLHINCGVACHNDGLNSKAEVTDLRMKLNPADLDGRSPVDFEMYKNLVGQAAKTTQWIDRTRIVPGNAEESLVYELATTRLPSGEGNRQMPPLATRMVPTEHTDLLREWIEALEPMTEAGQTGPE